MRDRLAKIYPKTNANILDAAAANMIRLLRPFADDRDTMDPQIQARITDDLAQRYANTRYNMQVQNLGGKIRLTQASAGVQFLAGFLLPTAGISLTRYKTMTMTETEESLAAVQEVQKT
jgi:hypothetical protein